VDQTSRPRAPTKLPRSQAAYLPGIRRSRVAGEYRAAVGAEFGTWHHGLIARFWAEFLIAEPEERAYISAV